MNGLTQCWRGLQFQNLKGIKLGLIGISNKISFNQNVLKDPVISSVYLQSSKETVMIIPYAYQKNQFDFKAGKEIAKNIINV
jgi:hypothetical protein